MLCLVRFAEATKPILCLSGGPEGWSGAANVVSCIAILDRRRPISVELTLPIGLALRGKNAWGIGELTSFSVSWTLTRAALADYSISVAVTGFS